MTDGEADRDSALISLNKLIETSSNLWKEIWFLCLGFSPDHDAQFLSDISWAGT